MKIYTVRDSKAEAYLPPFNMRSNGEALRSFADEANNPQSGLGAHPEDYTLFLLGAFDVQTGVITLEPSPVALGVAVNYVHLKTE